LRDEDRAFTRPGAAILLLGFGTFVSAPVANPAVITNSAEAVDLDDDGDLDVALATRNLDRLQWLENRGRRAPVPSCVGRCRRSATARSP
jgi:hypothetical protein